MKTLFSDIYNKIMDLFQIERSENTSECATNRLQVILMHDRTKLDPLIMSKMREELIDVFSKYVVIDKEELEIGLKNEGDAVALMLNIPIVRAKTEQELEELRKQLQKEEEKVKDGEEDSKDEEETETDEAKDEENEVIVDGEVTEVIIESTTPQAPDKKTETETNVEVETSEQQN